MLNRMCQNDGGGECRKAPVIRRHHSPRWTPSDHMANRWMTSSWFTTSAAYASTLRASSAQVTRGAATTAPPKVVRACRTSRLPPWTHSGHWWPTAASRMQSGQIGRAQRWQRT